MKTINSINRNLIYISAGDREVFASYAINNLVDYFDVGIFYYGEDQKKIEKLAESASFFTVGKGTKFNSFKLLTQDTPEIFDRYDTIWLCDDDLIVVKGDLRAAPKILKKYNLKILSPAYSVWGRMSHNIMRPHLWNRVFRFVNFVEMGSPLFDSQALKSFLNVYDGSLDGQGIDWWYCNFMKCDSELVAGIVDSIVFKNPYERDKSDSDRELDRYSGFLERKAQWGVCQSAQQLQVWPHRNLGSVVAIQSNPTAINIIRSKIPESVKKNLRPFKKILFKWI
jgi:hypothetical protein